MQPTIGQKAPNLRIAQWAQGEACNFDALDGRAALVKVFQVNCPGCFLHAFPEAADLHHRYAARGLVVFALATAFEDFDKNTFANLKLLAESGEVIGETKRALAQHGLLKDGALPYAIPFALGMDELNKCGEAGAQDAEEFARAHVKEFDQLAGGARARILEQVHAHLAAKEYRAESFELYALRGTPSTILVDAEGILRDVSFGQDYALEEKVRAMLGEK